MELVKYINPMTGMLNEMKVQLEQSRKEMVEARKTERELLRAAELENLMIKKLRIPEKSPEIEGKA